MWEQTQALLKANRQGWQSNARLQMPFLLTGLLFDPHGNRFSPVQGRRGSQYYRYYVNQVVLQFRGTHPHQIRRMPAEPLEQGVINAVLEALKEEEGVQAWVNHLKELNECEQQVEWRQHLTRVEVCADRLRVTFNLTDVTAHGLGNPEQDVEGEMKPAQDRHVEIPWSVNRRGGRTEFQFHGALAQAKSQPHEGLVTAVVLAFGWKEDLMGGRVSTVKALAQREGLARSYVMRILRLSFLAPDLIEAILNGQQPAELTLEPFRHPIPLEWTVQRKFFSLPPL